MASTSASTSAQPSAIPQVNVTPASPVTASSATMKEKVPTDSETALVGTSTGASAAAVDNKPSTSQPLARRLSSKGASKPAISTSTAPRSATSNPTRPAETSKAGQKKKKKRKGLAGLFLALGCLSAADFEDEPPKKSPSVAQPPKPAMAQKTTTTPATIVDDATAGPSQPTAESAHQAEEAMGTTGTTETGGTATTSAMTGNTLVGESDKERSAVADDGAPVLGEVILGPVEPVLLPEEEVSKL
ncbi:hypothetical protein BCR39DRAFT_302375 [Naematelia encephala]|uniref:Uncharacterized protein n=1 Tax=Naematelia encephala TaxID=71784 RepID=A0A1Y2BF54_9TREE|nr:hypothetical protein BCR39DRAFT_302375 [Naematelia encephala]